jgi:hypothetical protein
MKQNDSDTNFKLTLSRPLSQNKRNLSNKKSLKSMDKLFLTDEDGQVFSEKCLLNQKNYFRFSGNLNSLKTISNRVNSKKKERKLVNNYSCDKIEKKKSICAGSKSGFFSSTHFENSEKPSSGRTGNHSNKR